MARVTVEDCVDKVPNRFELVMLASHRAREISSGGELTVDRDNDKNPVVALREIADETQQSDDLRERMIEANQTQIEVDEPEEQTGLDEKAGDEVIDRTSPGDALHSVSCTSFDAPELALATENALTCSASGTPNGPPCSWPRSTPSEWRRNVPGATTYLWLGSSWRWRRQKPV